MGENKCQKNQSISKGSKTRETLHKGTLLKKKSKPLPSAEARGQERKVCRWAPGLVVALTRPSAAVGSAPAGLTVFTAFPTGWGSGRSQKAHLGGSVGPTPDLLWAQVIIPGP